MMAPDTAARNGLKMPLKVIGAGLGRTGTLSLKLALEQLGNRPCYHMAETLQHPEHDAQWLALARGETHDWRAILDGYGACVDWPSIMIWKELIETYPDAKVILTLRDPERWYASASNTIFARMREYAELLTDGGHGTIEPARRNHMRMVKTVVMDKAFGGNLERDHAMAVFNAHNEQVRRTVPPERLLIYESGEGWERLCAFLGVAVPEAPYPKVNTTEDFAVRFPARR